MSHLYAVVAKVTTSRLWCLGHTGACRVGKAILPLYLTVIRHQQEDQVHFGASVQKLSL